jgi:hypothetical protein
VLDTVGENAKPQAQFLLGQMNGLEVHPNTYFCMISIYVFTNDLHYFGGEMVRACKGDSEKKSDGKRSKTGTKLHLSKPRGARVDK